jgi:hypothetical protein
MDYLDLLAARLMLAEEVTRCQHSIPAQDQLPKQTSVSAGANASYLGHGSQQPHAEDDGCGTPSEMAIRLALRSVLHPRLDAAGY